MSVANFIETCSEFFGDEAASGHECWHGVPHNHTRQAPRYKARINFAVWRYYWSIDQANVHCNGGQGALKCKLGAVFRKV